MPRKRMIDPEFWSDEEIGTTWSHSARLFYIALWNFADDEGRFKAHSNLLKSQIFPYEPKVDIEKLKIEVSTKIVWYSNDDLQYGFIRNFLKHQKIDRPLPSKLPPPPEFDESSMKARRLLVPNRIEENRIEEKRRDVRTSVPSTATNFIQTLKTTPAYKGIDIDRELSKMDAWLLTHPGRKKTQRFIVNWLNKIDKIVEVIKPIQTDSTKDREAIRKMEAEAVPPPQEFINLKNKIGKVVVSIMLCVSFLCGSASAREPVDVQKLATAIFWAEGGYKTSHPYGILAHYKQTTPRQACINTINHALRDWDGKGDFISFLGSRYCPVGVANDPTGLNKNWIKNVTRLYNSPSTKKIP